MKVITTKSIAIGVCLLTAGCLSTSAESKKDYLLLTGSSTVAPLMNEIAERYEATHPTVEIDIQTGGSNKGIEDVRSGANDIGMASRSLKSNEEALHVFTIAQDGIALLLHQDNPVSELSKQQIVDIYTGTVENWSDVGGDDGSIEVLSKTANHATFNLFSDYFEIEAEEIKSDQLLGDNEEVLRIVQENPTAIGYVSVGAAEYQIVHGMPLKLMPLEGISATIANVSSGDFPLARPLSLITQETPVGLQKEFIDFARSPAVADIIEEQAFVPAGIAE